MSWPSVGIVGAGISGLSLSHELHDGVRCVLYEKESSGGGLLRCTREAGALYHRVGGHVFNSTSDETRERFLEIVGGREHFYKHPRDAVIRFDDRTVNYPIENHLKQLAANDTQQVVSELAQLAGKSRRAENFKEHLLSTFGRRLCELYFFPYNEKVWRGRLEKISTSWLEGKLPQPSAEHILTSNITGEPERGVHYRFFYPKEGGSQFVIERFAQGRELRKKSDVWKISPSGGSVAINDKELHDVVVYTGDITRAADVMAFDDPHLEGLLARCRNLRARGMQNVLVKGGRHEASWTYLPESRLAANRVIHTGNFSPTNSPSGTNTGVVEFGSKMSEAELEREVKAIDSEYDVLASHYTEKAYVVQEEGTAELIEETRRALARHGVFLLGRFAEWQYYNVDKCMQASVRVAASVQHYLRARVA